MDSNEIVFYNLSSYVTKLSHGNASIWAKLDSGSPITVFNTVALQILIGGNIHEINKSIKMSGTPSSDYSGYNGQSSTLYLCRLSNIKLDKYPIDNMLIAVNLDYPIGKDGKPIPKVLIGKHFIDCCSGQFDVKGDIKLTPDRSMMESFLKESVLMSFGIGKEKDRSILFMDEVF